MAESVGQKAWVTCSASYLFVRKCIYSNLGVFYREFFRESSHTNIPLAPAFTCSERTDPRRYGKELWWAGDPMDFRRNLTDSFTTTHIEQGERPETLSNFRLRCGLFSPFSVLSQAWTAGGRCSLPRSPTRYPVVCRNVAQPSWPVRSVS